MYQGENAHLWLITHYSWRKALIEVNPGVSTHVMIAVGYNSNMCSPINQDWTFLVKQQAVCVFRGEEMASDEQRV